MNFDLTEPQLAVQKAARDFARREVEPRAAELDRTARWPAEIVAGLGALGLLGVAVPKEHGGAGLDHVSLALVVEEISAACAGSGAIVSVSNALFCGPLLRFGTATQKREILAPTASGKMLGCFGANDPAGGAEAQPTITVAEKQGDGSFVLNGAKSFVTLGPEAEHALVLARTTRDPDPLRHTALLVRRGSPGYTFSPLDGKMGLRAAPSCTLLFENVRVPASHVLGEEGQGLEIAMAAVDGGRVGIAAQAVGIARAAFEEAAAYAKAHRAAGSPGAPVAAGPIASLQAIQFLLSDMAVELDGARLLTLRAARMQDDGAPHLAAESSMAKLFASETATRVTHKALQILGADGYTTGYGAERHYRDARITEIDEGTSEIQRAVIASSVLQG